MEYPVAQICRYETLKGQGGVVVCGRWVLIYRKRHKSSTNLIEFANSNIHLAEL